MKAFIQVDPDGEFVNENAYSAWRAFRHYGYEVVKLKDNDVLRAPITRETPCHAGVGIMKLIHTRLGIRHKELISYPTFKDIDESFVYGREIETIGLDEFRQRVCRGERWFGKPRDEQRKLFTGQVFASEMDLIKIGGLPPELEILCSQVVDNILSEYRVCIFNGEILDARKYRGDFSVAPDKGFVQALIKGMYDAPKAYCLDVMCVREGKKIWGGVNTTYLVELTDAFSFGHYGLDMVLYGKMLIARWNEIMGM